MVLSFVVRVNNPRGGRYKLIQDGELTRGACLDLCMKKTYTINTLMSLHVAYVVTYDKRAVQGPR